MRAAYAVRRNRIVAGLRAIPGVEVSMPRGAFYALADVRALLGRRCGDTVLATDEAFARMLLERERVAVVPGSAFAAAGYLRLSYAASLADIDAAVERLAAFAGALQPAG
jgi:aspartate/methionine/tyrosine aminotransferase